MPPQATDPAIIGKAPIELEAIVGANSVELAQAYEDLGFLSDQLAEAEAEIERLKGQNTIQTVKAGMMKPYANKVYWFVVGYCAVVGVFLLLDGFALGGFGLKETTIGIIAGSTAVSVIGLIGMVISGLFNAKD